MANDINLVLGVDDTSLFASLNKADAELIEVQKEATKTGNVIDAAFKEGAQSVDKFNNELNQTGGSFKKAENSSKSLRGQMREFQRDLRAISLVSVGQALVGSITPAIEGMKQFNAILSPTFALQQAVNGAIKESASNYAAQRRELNGVFAIANDVNATDEERQAALDKINEQYGQYLPNLLTETSSLKEKNIAQDLINKGLIKNIAIKAQQAEQERLVGELIESNRNLEIARQLEKTSGDLLTQASVKSTIALEQQRNNSIKAQLKGLATVGKQVEEALLGLDAQLIAENVNLGDSFDKTGIAADVNADKLKTLAKDAAKPLQGSLADLEAQLSAVNKKIQENTKANDAAGLLPLIEQAKGLEKQINDAKTAIDKLFGKDTISESDRVAKELELIESLLLDQETIEINAVLKRSLAREQEINNIIKDDSLKDKLLKENTLKTQIEIAEIQKQFQDQQAAKRSEKQAADIEAAQKELDTQIALDEAKLREKQAADNLLLQQTGATEQQVTDLQAQQEQERQRLTLESEKKRLELTLRFAQGRSQAEIDAVKLTIAAIDKELQGLGQTVTDNATKGGKKSIFDVFGLSADTPEGAAAIEAIKSGVNEVTNQLQNLFAKRVELANQAVAARDSEISRLRTQLNQELQLNEQGLASNVTLVQKQLAEQEAARQKAIEQQKKAVAAQQALETVLQAVNLVTAASNIFQSLSPGFPYTLPIAIGTIAAMVGSFIAFKVKAAKATRLHDGGLIDPVGQGGRDDRNGGAGHRVEGTNIIVGGGEFVTNAVDTAEQLPLLRAINNGDFRGKDLLSLIEGGNQKAVTLNVQRQYVEETKQKNTDKALIKEMRKQGKKQLQKLDKLIDKPSLTPHQDGYYLLQIDAKGNKKVQKINLK